MYPRKATTIVPKTAIEARASLNVVDRIVLARSAETITNSSHGVDQRITLAAINLSTHASDVNINNICSRIKMKVPYMLQQHGSRYDLALVLDEVFEQFKFTWEQGNTLAAAADRS